MDVSCSLEEGEIADSETSEVSLSADKFLVSHLKREPKTICSDESSNENSEESDDDSDALVSQPKRAKQDVGPQAPPSRNQVPNKYKVWSTALQEEALTENLNKCDVESVDRERSVESYNYKLFQKTDNYSYNEQPMSEHHFDDGFVRCDDEDVFVLGSKRRRGNIKKRLGRKRNDFQPRYLKRLSVTAENSCEEVAKDIAYKLHEKKEELILSVVCVLGIQKAIDLYNETKKVEDSGGMLLMSGERRRTPGGVYLLLLKRDDTISSEDIKSIFADDVKDVNRKKKAAYKKKHMARCNKIRETVIREKLLNLNTAAFAPSSESNKLSDRLDAEDSNLEEGEIELTVTNPPPSPATDQDTPPSHTHAESEDEADLKSAECVSQPDNLGRKMVSYEDSDEDYLAVNLDADDMDVF